MTQLPLVRLGSGARFTNRSLLWNKKKPFGEGRSHTQGFDTDNPNFGFGGVGFFCNEISNIQRRDVLTDVVVLPYRSSFKPRLDECREPAFTWKIQSWYSMPGNSDAIIPPSLEAVPEPKKAGETKSGSRSVCSKSTHGFGASRGICTQLFVFCKTKKGK